MATTTLKSDIKMQDIFNLVDTVVEQEFHEQKIIGRAVTLTKSPEPVAKLPDKEYQPDENGCNKNGDDNSGYRPEGATTPGNGGGLGHPEVDTGETDKTELDNNDKGQGPVSVNGAVKTLR